MKIINVISTYKCLGCTIKNCNNYLQNMKRKNKITPNWWTKKEIGTIKYRKRMLRRNH